MKGMPREHQGQIDAGVHGSPANAIYRGVTRMVGRSAALAVLALISAGGLSLAKEPAYLGNWARGDGKTRIHVASCGADVCARNTWVRHGVSGEKVGDRLILNIKAASSGRWSGNAFDPQRHRTYSIGVRIINTQMTTRGCMMDGLVCQSMNWSRMHRT